jgi:hypothetical protein
LDQILRISELVLPLLSISFWRWVLGVGLR